MSSQLPYTELDEDGGMLIPDEYESPDEGMVEMPDGGVLVLDETKNVTGNAEFDENLAETLPPETLLTIGRELCDLLERDGESRKARDKLYKEGLLRTGMDLDAKVGADFDGASQTVHPVLAEATIDISARAIRELFPPEGPVKTKIVGEETPAKLDKAERKRDYLNWQLTTQVIEYRRELEQLLTQCALAGSQFMKWYRDNDLKRPCAEFVPSDQILLPFSASSFRASRRKAHIIKLTQEEYESRIDSGWYYDPYVVSAPSTEPDMTAAEEEAAKIEGKEQTGYNEDGTRTFYEAYVWWVIKEDKLKGKAKSVPYIITLDEYNKRPVGIYRNWEQTEEDKVDELQWIVEWPLIPWRGALTVGLVHLIGGLSVSATGALNALLDSAHINNAPTALTLKGSMLSGQNKQINIGETVAIEGPAGIDDIRKLAMPMPYNAPSQVLFQLLGWLTEAAKGVVTTASEKLADATNEGPVGTTYALIEQGAIVFSTIHGRQHAAQAESLAILCRINGKHLKDREVVKDLGDLVTSRQDFLGPMDVQPVSDPNIFSEAQRWTQLQTAFQLSADPAVPYNKPALHRRALKLLKFPQAEEILPEEKNPEPVNPVTENVNAAQGKPLMAFPHENHIAHLKSHLAFVVDPILQMIATPASPALFAHVNQHITYMYAQICQSLASKAIEQDITGLMVDSRYHNDVDSLLASCAPHVHEVLGQVMQQFAQPLQQLAQIAQQVQQSSSQVPMDPRSQVALQVGMAEIQRKQAADQAKQQLEAQNLQLREQTQQQEQVLKEQREQADQQRTQVDAQIEAMKIKLEKDLADRKQETDQRLQTLADENEAARESIKLQNEHALEIQKMYADLEKNLQDNETKIVVAELKAKVETAIADAKALSEAQRNAQEPLIRILEAAIKKPELTPAKEEEPVEKAEGGSVKRISVKKTGEGEYELNSL